MPKTAATLDNRFSAWLRHADHDLETAELLLAHRPQMREIICFHCQQAAEKYLKGYLIIKAKGQADPPTIHNLSRLCDLCSLHDERFGDISGACAYLTEFSDQALYPGGAAISAGMTEKAVGFSLIIKTFAPFAEIRDNMAD